MSYKIAPTPEFERELKRLAKKYPSIKNDLSSLVLSLIENPKSGTLLGNNFFKISMSMSSKNKGKSGGARIITYLRIVEEVLYLVAIYDKSESASISDTELLKRINDL